MYVLIKALLIVDQNDLSPQIQIKFYSLQSKRLVMSVLSAWISLLIFVEKCKDGQTEKRRCIPINKRCVGGADKQGRLL